MPTASAAPGGTTDRTDRADGERERVPLSVPRLRRLERHAVLAAGLATVAAAGAWLTIFRWAPGLWVWPVATHGFRYWLVFGLITLLFVLLTSTVWGNLASSWHNAAAGRVVCPHAQVGGLTLAAAVVLSVPRWPDVVAAWTHNTPAPLTVHWGLWLATLAPALAVGAAVTLATEYGEYTAYRLERAQHAQRAETEQARTGRGNRLVWAVMPGPRSGQQ